MTWAELCSVVQRLADHYPTWVVRAGLSGEETYSMTVWDEWKFGRGCYPVIYFCESVEDLNYLFPPEAHL